MLSQNQLKHLRALSLKKYRQLEGQFLVEGDKMVTELLLQNQIEAQVVFALDSWLEKNAGLLRQFSGKIQSVTEAELAKISTLTTPNQVLAVAYYPSEPAELELPLSNLCFFLDGIQDPGNLGSILRVADWFGFPAVFCSPDCVDAFSPKVVQASMGSILRVKTWELNLSDMLEKTLGIVVAGAVLDGVPVFDTQLPQSGLLVIGNEGRGISIQNENLLTHRISIPRHLDGRAESLNAAVAAGILAAAFRR